MPYTDKRAPQFFIHHDDPIIGPWVSRIGRITQILSNPCSPTPEIVFQAFIHGLGVAIWSFFKPSPTDFLGQRLFRGEHGSSEHGAGGGGRMPRFRGDMWLTDFMNQSPPEKGTLKWFLFRGGSLLRALGWYFSIIDATTQGAVTWASLTYLWSGCDTGQGSYIQMHAPEGVILFSGVWIVYNQWHIDAANVTGGSGTGITNPRQSNIMMISWSLTGHAPDVPGLENTEADFQLTDIATGQELGSGSVTRNRDGSFTGAGAYYTTTAGNDFSTASVMYKLSGGGVFLITGGFLSYTSVPRSDVPLPVLNFGPFHD